MYTNETNAELILNALPHTSVSYFTFSLFFLTTGVASKARLIAQSSNAGGSAQSAEPTMVVLRTFL